MSLWQRADSILFSSTASSPNNTGRTERHLDNSEILDFIRDFDIAGVPVGAEVCNTGHINRTYIVTTESEHGEGKYILQRINTSVFTNPDELMHNIENVTAYLRREIAAEGGDPDRETLSIVRCGGKLYRTDADGGVWRVYVFVPGTRSYDSADTPEMLEAAGLAFGRFRKRLSDFPAAELHETLPRFHDTAKRYRDFLTAVNEDRAGRAESVKNEIEFIKARAEKFSYITDRISAGRIPLRVTHNDTKLNNVLIDTESGKAVCVVDLDTVMPGSVLYDFGDGIRFGASSAAEDERELDRVFVRLDMFDGFAKGFIAGCGGSLTDEELDALPMGAYIITAETGMRFLADHLNGDTYFSIHRENHNLDRARTQLKLVSDMETKLGDMERIIAKYR